MSALLTVLSLIGFIALTAGTALFVAAEFSLTALERSTVEAHAREGDRRARQVRKAHRTLSFQLSEGQLGITITTLITGYIAEPVLARLLEPLFDALGLDSGASHGISLALALILATSLSMIYGELVPKNIAIAAPLATARWTAGPMMWFSTAFRWLINFLNGTANWAVQPSSGSNRPRSCVRRVHRRSWVRWCAPRPCTARWISAPHRWWIAHCSSVSAALRS